MNQQNSLFSSYFVRFWKSSKNRPFVLSLSIHLLLLSSLIFTSLLTHCKRVKKVHVFQIQSPTHFSPESSPPLKSSPSLPPSKEITKTPHTKNKINDPVPPSPQKSPTKKNPTEKISYQEFLKQQKTSPQKKSPPPPTKKNPQQSTFDLNKIKQKLHQVSSSTQIQSVRNPLSPASQNPLLLTQIERYVSEIKSIIDQLWEQSQFSSDQTVSSSVEFYIDQSGRITKYKFIQSSQLKAFNQSIESIFEKLKKEARVIAGPPPPNQDGWYRLTFEINS